MAIAIGALSAGNGGGAVKRRLALLLSAFAVAVAAVASAAGEGDIKFYGYANDLGAGGYDVVAYFDESQPVEGDARFQAAYAGETWQFSSAANRDTFVADPARYIPQYGGHCAYGVAQGYLVRGDPEAWTVRDGALYLNYNKSVRRQWLTDVPAYLRDSEKNWKELNR